MIKTKLIKKLRKNEIDYVYTKFFKIIQTLIINKN